MGAAKKLNYKKMLRDLVPINALSEAHINEVAKKAAIEQVREGRYVFRKGDRDYQSVYLLDGSVELIGDNRDIVSTVEAGSADALHPLAHKQPRQLSVRAAGKVTVARIDSRLVDVLLTWDESAGYDVVEIGSHDDDDWMTRMLQSQAFMRLPPSHIHQLLLRLESVNFSAGDVVIQQGEEGDYFYIVKNGRLAVTRKASAQGNAVLLAELGRGAFFGEEALVSDAKRNASVKMVTDGLLMRLSKDDFNELLRETLVHEADFSEAQDLVSGGARWLDVRLPGEFENCSIGGSSNLPLSALRDQCADLDPNTSYIVCCDTGRRSSAAAFVLSQRGFNVYVLKNGLADVPDEALTGEAKQTPTGGQAKEADVIPFEAENISPGRTGDAGPQEQTQSTDSTLVDKLAAVENQNLSLKRQIEKAEKRFAQAKSALQAAESRYREQQAGAQQAAREIDKLRSDQQQRERQIDEQAQTAQQEVAALRAELDSVKQSSDTSQQRFHAMEGEKNSLQQEVARLQQALSELQTSTDDRNSELKGELQKREKTLEEERNQRELLQRQLGELEDSRKALREQCDSATERADAAQFRAAELEQHSVAYTQQLQVLEGQQAEREELEERLEKAQQSLQERGERYQEMAEQVQRAEQNSAQAQKELDQARADGDELRRQLDELKPQYVESEKRASELSERLASVEKEHASDIGSLRGALTRAQDERENVTREQTRLLGALRKAERDLEGRRQDHETEVHRLQKELKEAAGESSRALAAELDALQAQIKENTKQRDDLEIQLGERSAQLENVQAEAEKLRHQLEREQQQARQTEQQLIEANRAATEEMKTRLGAEQQALREQLEVVSSERNQNQEQITVLKHALQELREEVQQARDEQAANTNNVQALQDAERQVQSLREAVQQLELARDEASQLHNQAQQELDQLRAEVEVSRGLVDMQAAHGNGDEALHAELVETKTNVDVALRLRLQAEGRVAELQQQVERLQSELSQTRAETAARIHDLGTSSPAMPVPHSPAGLANQGKVLQDAASESENDTNLPDAATGNQAAVAAQWEDSGRRGGWKAMVAVFLVFGLAALAAYWWFLGKPSANTAKTHVDMSTEALEATRLTDESSAVETAEPAANPQAKEGPRQLADDPKALPSFIKGMPQAAKTVATDVSTESEVSRPENPAVEPAEGIADAVESQPATDAIPTQPVRSFSEALSDGGTAPAIVEFRADSFEMGSSSASPNFSERPRHRVKLKRFGISENEVTFAQYDRFAKATGRAKPNSRRWGRGDRPAINVSWQDAMAYTRWLSEQTGSRYRLPTEAEWEFAARAGTVQRFWWGNTVGESKANCFDCGGDWAGKQTAPVGSYAANAYGLHDMAGNVMEWVQDCYKSGYADAPTDGSAVEFSGCEQRVVRGGGYDSPADLLRSASRSQRPQAAKLDNLGFRVVREF